MMRSKNFSLLAIASALLVAGATSAKADINIDWTTLGISGSYTQFTSPVTFTGNTTGDEVIPFTVTLTPRAGTNAWYSIGTQGNTPNSLLLLMGDPTGSGTFGRSLSDGIDLDVTFSSLPSVPGPWASSFTMLDIDTGPAGVSQWQDELTVTSPGGAILQTLPGSTVSLAGNVGTGTTNVPFNGTAGNVITYFNSLPTTFAFSYVPGASDGLTGGNQLVGVNGVGFRAPVSAAPEPGTLGLLGLVAPLAMRLRRRK
jgi:hypothetical protein